MRVLRSFRLRIGWLFKRPQAEADLDAELQDYIEKQTEKHISSGLSFENARLAALRDAGGIEQVKEECRDARGTRWLEELLQDFRYAVRIFRKARGFTLVALLTLALGIGATTVMFSITDGVLLKPLSYPEPDRLLSLHEQTEKYGNHWSFAYLNFLDCKRESRSLMSVVAWRYSEGVVSEPGEAEFVSGRQVSAGFFSVVGIPLLRGRGFLPGEDQPGGTPVAVISYRLWQNRFAGNSGAIGTRLVFDGKPYTIIGIAPAGLQLSGVVDVFTPLGQNTAPTMQNREMHPGINVIARLRPGVTLSQAQAALGVIGRRLAEEYPKADAGRTIGAEPLRREIVGDVRPTLWLLFGAVSLVLLIACVNIASLLLARAVSRERELAVRVALGAGRGRLIRQCLTESVALALCGGILGVGIAAAGTHPFLTFWPGGLPRAEDVHLNWQVLLFTVAASLLCGLLFGLAPSFRAPTRQLEQTLRARSRTLAGSSRRLHSGFVITEIAIAFVLLIAAGMLGHTLLRIASINPGIDPHNLLITRVALSSDALASPERIRTAWRDVLDRVRQVPGVQSVAVADVVPMGADTEEIGYWTTPAAPPANHMPLSQMNLVTPGYLQVMRIPLLAGRFFDEHDRIGSEPVTVIDEVFAKKVFRGKEAVGNRLWLQFLGPVRIVGVVGHVLHRGPVDPDDQVQEQLYLPFAQLPDPFLRLTSAGMSLLIRTNIPPLGIVERIRQQIRGTTRDQAIYDVQTMEQRMSGTFAKQRFLLVLFAIFAALALLLATIGIYGVLAYLTTQRVPEIGVRIALGASSHEVMRLVFRQSLGMTIMGVIVGLLASLAAGRVLEGLVNGVRLADPLTFATMTFVMLFAALLASFIPARRASCIDPMKALRQE